MISQGVTAPDREAFEEWFNAFNIKEMPEYQTIRDFSFAAWQAATAAKEAEIAALKAERDELLAALKAMYSEAIRIRCSIHQKWLQIMNTASAAIAKAEGRTE